MNITKWLHIQELGSDPWVLHIYSAWHQAAEQKRAAPRPEFITDMGLAITSRLNLLPRITRRLREDFDALAKDIITNATEDHYFTPEREGVALPVDDNRKYLVIADLHSLVTELDACIDAMKKFMHAVHEHLGKPLADKERIWLLDSWMRDKGIDPKWIVKLASCRNFVAHEGAFYLAIDASIDRYELLLVKKNVKFLDDPKTYVRLGAVDQIVEGFVACRSELQRHLVELFDAAA
ncbi:hypothetical protein [Paraburkholderia caledonica]|uniref:hypothetical protein n=1 Tax=Paraburkholderia caledonica TaxID=134536 RepID=UPI000B400DA3|nr:hypothetical protein [Paraburkholderia caledonica]